MRRPVIPCLLLLSAFALGGCAWLGFGRGLKSCRYSFQGVRFDGADFVQTHWRLDVGIANPNPRPVTLNRMHFALMHADDTLLSGWNPEKKDLAPGDSQVVETTLDLPYTVLARFPPAMLADTDARFDLVADAYLDTWLGQIRVPGAVRQTIHINMPEQISKFHHNLLRRFFAPPNGNPPPPRDDAPAAPRGGDTSGPAPAETL